MLGIIRLMSSDFVYLVDAYHSTGEDFTSCQSLFFCLADSVVYLDTLYSLKIQTVKKNTEFFLSGHVVFPENTNDEE